MTWCLATRYVAALLAVACSAEDGRQYTAEVPLADSVGAGAPVQFRGIEVGTVVRGERSTLGYRLTLSVTRADAYVRTADSVRVVPVGVFGDRGAEIVLGPLTAPEAPSGSHLSTAGVRQASIGQEAVLKVVVEQAMQELARRGLRDTTRRP
jgi:ABC-type transporter Mla subunit MlaD